MLPIAGSGPIERADAARNRQKIVRAAAKLVAAKGIDGLALDEVAAEAGVGIGTVYRRFPDKGALAQALLDENEREFQEAFISGPPPLGPGAPAAERLGAFLERYVDRLETHGELLMVAETETPMARFVTGAYRLHHSHLVALISEIEPETDAHFRADALLAPLAAAQYAYQRQSMTTEQIKRGLVDLYRPNA
ncbi:DNA-binding transcriptional regulator, AcrR family [Amycolatopsis lurida]|uniref:TetR family transcriptional regulator n=1 Tax=Amycolatopsis lurida NRRL 2430 TaxID=1460371 RepID=A0A2P2G1L3_AMYLU|nr:TetR/AcrR family transcriptional regulator [Amycolatopsis lurida]KFU82869.1 TetR family transcriptional regulator [Amycolatopsis lurida NRRL 2430]SEE00068.1 DNA-binding transcriptional regulator, AcrR family [Amycolatopsis lurida]